MKLRQNFKMFLKDLVIAQLNQNHSMWKSVSFIETYSLNDVGQVIGDWLFDEIQW